jgi:hypothetical protein
VLHEVEGKEVQEVLNRQDFLEFKERFRVIIVSGSTYSPKSGFSKVGVFIETIAKTSFLLFSTRSQPKLVKTISALAEHIVLICYTTENFISRRNAFNAKK